MFYIEQMLFLDHIIFNRLVIWYAHVSYVHMLIPDYTRRSAAHSALRYVEVVT